jgi:hypothetical protein
MKYIIVGVRQGSVSRDPTVWCCSYENAIPNGVLAIVYNSFEKAQEVLRDIECAYALEYNSTIISFQIISIA